MVTIVVMNISMYFLKRLASIPPTILAILYFLFVLFSAIGNPNSNSYFPSFSDSIFSYLGAFGKFVWNVLTGNWGYLVAFPKEQTFSGPVSVLISIYFFSTLEVVIFAATISLIVSFPLGRYLGTHHTYRFAKISRSITLLGYLTPAYVTALVLQILFGKGVIRGNPLAIFPITGAFDATSLPSEITKPSWLESNGILISSPTHMLLIDSLLHGDYTLAFNVFMHLVLPVATLVISITAIVTFLVSSAYTDHIGTEYVKSARSRGVPERQIEIRHVRPNAVLPVMASATIMVAFLLSNVIMMENVFDYPGIGLFLANTISYDQYYPTAVVIFLLGVMVMLISLTIDVIYFAKNPLIRREG